MAKRLLPPDWRVVQDDGSVATDATLAIRIAGTSTATAAYSDKELTSSLGSTITCDSYGYPASGGNEVALWGADDISYDIVVSATGYNGGSSRTLEDVAVADASTTSETASDLVFQNAFSNGGFESWSGGTSFSALSGDGDGDEVADGWYFTQPSAASNEVSRQAGFAIGSATVSTRYSCRVGRPSSSTSTNELRLWKVCAPEAAWRLRGKQVTLRYSVVAGANFSGTTLGVTVATGTSESEDGDNIDAGSFTGHVTALSTTKSISTTAARYEDTFTLAEDIKEIGVQFSYTGSGTAGAADYFTIQDVELKDAAADDDFQSSPAVLDYIRAKLTSSGTGLAPVTSDGSALGSTSLMWSDLFLASGAVVNWNNGDVTLTHSANTLAFAGASSGYTFDATVTATQATAATHAITAKNTNDAASVAALKIEGDRATPAANDEVYASFILSDSGGAQTEFARIAGRATTVTDASEEGELRFVTINAGSLGTRLLLRSTVLSPNANDGLALGTTSLGWADLHLATGGVINWANGTVTITESSDALAFAGASAGYTFTHAVLPSANDGAALGASGTAWSDLFLASGAVINFAAGDVTVTHSSNTLAFAGASTGYTFDAPVSTTSTLVGRVLDSTETTGALTSASANRRVVCTGGITLPSTGMTSGDFILIDPAGTARTVTRPGAHTMYIFDTDSATGTTRAHNVCLAVYHGSSKYTLHGTA